MTPPELEPPLEPPPDVPPLGDDGEAGVTMPDEPLPVEPDPDPALPDDAPPDALPEPPDDEPPEPEPECDEVDVWVGVAWNGADAGGAVWVSVLALGLPLPPELAATMIRSSTRPAPTAAMIRRRLNTSGVGRRALVGPPARDLAAATLVRRASKRVRS